MPYDSRPYELSEALLKLPKKPGPDESWLILLGRAEALFVRYQKNGKAKHKEVTAYTQLFLLPKNAHRKTAYDNVLKQAFQFARRTIDIPDDMMHMVTDRVVDKPRRARCAWNDNARPKQRQCTGDHYATVGGYSLCRHHLHRMMTVLIPDQLANLALTFATPGEIAGRLGVEVGEHRTNGVVK